MLNENQFNIMVTVRTIIVAVLMVLPGILYFWNIITNIIVLYVIGSIILIIVSIIGLYPSTYTGYVEQQKKIAAIKDKHKADKDSRIKD